MKIKDKRVKRWLRSINCLELDERIDEYPEDERDGRSDIQFFADELSYAIENYNEILMEKKDFHGWTEDKAWVVGNGLTATVEFDDGEPMEFPSYDEAVDWLYERGYRI